MNLFEKHAALNQLFQHSPVDAAYLSGTLATRASFGAISDVDIAILLAGQIATDQFLDYQLYFLSELTRRLETDTLDVVILNQASLLLKLQVIRYGQILYSRDEKKRASFEARAVMDYLDFRQMDDLQNQAIARRLRAPILTLDHDGLRQGLSRLAHAHKTLVDTVDDHLTAPALEADERLQAIIERSLILAIEALVYCATLIYAGMQVKQPETYSEVLAPLGAREIVPRDVIANLEPLIAVRDILLRTPEMLARGDLLALAQHAIADLAAFAAALHKLIGEGA
jgi:uncharacterized protein YutE (UPF0331/DUF86 family)/predicted nucleotidyltransferase